MHEELVWLVGLCELSKQKIKAFSAEESVCSLVLGEFPLSALTSPVSSYNS